MPAVTGSTRNGLATGRFPSVTLGFGEDEVEDEEEPREENAEEGKGCRAWWRRVCPCCCPHVKDDDVTDTVITDTDDADKDKDKDKEKPDTGEGELEGN